MIPYATIEISYGKYVRNLNLTATDERGRTAVFSVNRSEGQKGCLSSGVHTGRIPADMK